MIEKIRMINFKSARDLEIEIAEVVLLCGPNGSGKTQTIQATKLAITGALPEASVSGTADVFKLANSTPDTNYMGVEISVADSRTFRRSWDRTLKRDPASGETKEKITQEIDLSPEPADCGTKLSSKEGVIRQWAGLDPVVVDVRAFLAMSGDKRRDFFYRLGESSEVTGARIKKLLKECARGEAKLAGVVLHEISVELVDLHGGDLDYALKWLAEEKSTATREIQNARGAAVKMAEAQSERKTVAGDLRGLKTELDQARKDKEMVVSELAKNAPLFAALESRQGRTDSLSARIVRLKEGGADIGAIKKTIVDRNEREPKQREENATAQAKLEKAHQEAGGLYETAKAEAATALRVAQGLRSQKNAFEELGDIRDQLCEKCSPLFPSSPDMDKKIVEKDGNSKTANEAEGKAYQKTLITNSALNEAITAGKLSEGDLRNEILALETKRDTEEAAASTRGAELEEAENELKDVLAKKVENPVATDGMEQQLAGLKTRIETLEAQLDAKQEEENELNIQLRSVGDADAAQTRLYCIKQMIKVLGPSGLKGDLVKEKLNPIKLEVNESLRLFGIEGVEFSFRTVDGRGTEIFDFGWKNGGNYIAFDSLSTGQGCILLACLVAVICKHSQSPLKLLALDNLEVISADYEEKFLRGLPKVAEYCGLDNVIAASSKTLPESIVGTWPDGSRIPADVCQTAIEGMEIIEFPLIG
ncbi:MAG: AAA family ATPase [Candidatus Glassbacteria bacterium]|nr:AAA family ATPase [Candidatus Glassbacteria bacterium]